MTDVNTLHKDELRLAEMMRRHCAELEPLLTRLKADAMGEIDPDCECDHCLGLAATCLTADELSKSIRGVIEWFESPVASVTPDD